MAFEDVIMHWAYKVLDTSTTGFARWKTARQKASAQQYGADAAVSDLLDTWGSMLDLWAGMVAPSATPVLSSVTVVLRGSVTPVNQGTPLVGTPITLGSAPTGSLACTQLDPWTPGGAVIDKQHLATSLSGGTTLNVTLTVTGGAPVVPGLYHGWVTENGTPIAQIVCLLGP